MVNNTFRVATGFSVNAALPLLEIEVPVFFNGPISGTLPNQPLLVELVGPYPSGQQTPGVPPTVIESWVIDPLGSSGVTSVRHLTSTLQPVLDPAQRYFVQMSSAGLSEAFQWAWNINSTGAKGWVTGPASGWVFSPNQDGPALEVLGGDSSQATAPEPASIGLMGAGLAASLLLRRRFGH